MSAIRKRTVHAPDHVAKRTLDFKLKLVSSDAAAGTVTIEGWANPATVDRGGELVNPAAWDLKNFKNNPVLLFNHGKDPNYGMLPVGRVTDIGATDQGLYAKAVISVSKDAKISVIRDLVSEGILKTFSVGFDPGTETQEGGVNHVDGGELLELSIVTIPMNQDATFAVTSKDYSGMKQKLTVVGLKTKGALVAAEIQQRMGELQQEDANFERDDAMADIARLAEADLSDVKNVLSGETVDVPPSLLKAFSTRLEMDLSNLKKLNAGDVELAKKKPKDAGAVQAGATGKAAPPPLRADSPVSWATDAERNAPKPEPTVDNPEVKTEDKATPPTAPTAPVDTAAPAASPPPPAAPAATSGPKVQAVKVPKEAASSQDEAASMVGDAGWDNSQGVEDEGGWTFVQADPEQFEPESLGLMDLGNGCMAQVGMPKETQAKDAPSSDPGAPAVTPFAVPQSPGPWGKKIPKPKKGEESQKSADPSEDEIDEAEAEKPTEPPPEDKAVETTAAPAQACAACMAKAMKEGLAAGHSHPDNKAIAVSKCKAECPTDKDDMPEGTAPYAQRDLEMFCDGWQTSHDQIKSDALNAAASNADLKSGKAPTKQKQAGQDPGPTTPIPSGGTADASAGLEGNAFLQAAQQTNVLLGNLISVMNEVSKKLDGVVQPSGDGKAQEVSDPAAAGGAISKALEVNYNYLNQLNARLKKLQDADQA